MAEISIQQDFEEINNALKNMRVSIEDKKLHKAILTKVSAGCVSSAKRSFSNYLNKRTGALKKSIKKVVYKNGVKAYVHSTAQADNKTRYGYVLAHGTTITPKVFKKKTSNGYLTFKIGEKWVRTHQVTIKPHNFIVEPSQRYMNSAECKLDVENRIQQMINDWEKKNA